MWTCKQCGEKLEEQFDACWRCSTKRQSSSLEAAPASPAQPDPPPWRLTYRMFRGTLATWDDLFTKAAYFASEIGPERIMNISHSVDDGDGVVAVWYWTTEPPPTPDGTETT